MLQDDLWDRRGDILSDRYYPDTVGEYHRTRRGHGFIWPLNLINVGGGQSGKRNMSTQRFTRLKERDKIPPGM